MNAGYFPYRKIESELHLILHVSFKRQPGLGCYQFQEGKVPPCCICGSGRQFNRLFELKILFYAVFAILFWLAE